MPNPATFGRDSEPPRWAYPRWRKAGGGYEAVMPTLPAGGGSGPVVPLIWRGPWAPGTTYAEGDAVSREVSGAVSSFVSTAAGNIGHDPATDGEVHWNLMAQHGAIGPEGKAGAAGAEGKEGKEGKTGPAGPAGAEGKEGKTGPAGPAGAEGKEGKEGKEGTLTVTPEASVERAIGAEIENATGSPVIVTVLLLLGAVEAKISLVAGGVNIIPPETVLKGTGKAMLSFSFALAAGAKWKYSQTAAVATAMFASYQKI